MKLLCMTSIIRVNCSALLLAASVSRIFYRSSARVTSIFATASSISSGFGFGTSLGFIVSTYSHSNNNNNNKSKLPSLVNSKKFHCSFPFVLSTKAAITNNLQFNSLGKNHQFSDKSSSITTIMSAKAPTKKSSTTKGKSKVEKTTTHNDDYDDTTDQLTTSTGIIHHIPKELLPSWMNQERTKVLTYPQVKYPKQTKQQKQQNDKDVDKQCVIYWMQRDVRTHDNWALLLAQHLAHEQQVPLHVIYTLPPPPTTTNTTTSSSSSQLPPKVWDMPITQRHGSFLLDGLQIVQQELQSKHVPFHILLPPSRNDVGQMVYEFASSSTTSSSSSTHSALAIVCDMSPLRQYRDWMERQAAPLLIQDDIPLYQVDAHNVVPVWLASPKREVGARTLRPKLNKLLPDFMTHFPSFDGNSHLTSKIQSSILSSTPAISWSDCIQYLKWDTSVPPVESIFPAGMDAAMKRFTQFCNSPSEGLKNFDTLRNDPNYKNVCSNLSPYVNYGHISFQRLALEVRALHKHPNGTASYIEEGIVRRELSDNFVYYTPDDYDELTSAAEWAQESLAVHASDVREYIYTLQEFEKGQTHDDLWNAAQLQLVQEGKMHGFLRMYWAKKILEWTESPTIALRTGLYLNDRFALDGNDPNGYVGVGWSVMGIHDMGWKEREIFGKIRYMNYAGCKRKFKIESFVARYPGAKANVVQAEKKKRGMNAASTTASKKRKT